jgi:hypothetical protein
MILFENRNGFLHAWDLEAGDWVVPADVEGFYLPHLNEITPEDMRAALEARGVKEVHVHLDGAAWQSGQANHMGFPNRIAAFRRAAQQAHNHPGVWMAVPVSRIDDGSDWSDIYGTGVGNA